jgi:hypothetical protein
LTHYTGTLRRGTDRDTIVGEIRDTCGWAIQLTGTRQADGTYAIVGVLGELPAALAKAGDAQ